MKLDRRSVYRQRGGSLSLRRAWIEILTAEVFPKANPRRSPYGERGLKFVHVSKRGGVRERRSPYGERGLKFAGLVVQAERLSRSPYGERGLKWMVSLNTGVYPVALLTESVD